MRRDATRTTPAVGPSPDNTAASAPAPREPRRVASGEDTARKLSDEDTSEAGTGSFRAVAGSRETCSHRSIYKGAQPQTAARRESVHTQE